MIDFKNIEEKSLPNFYNGDGEMIARIFADDINKIMLNRLTPNSSVGLHCHETSSEIIFILSGNAKAIVDGIEEILTEGSCHYCKKGQEHTLINTGDQDLVFFAVVPQQ